MIMSKRLQGLLKLVDRSKTYPFEEAMKLAKKTSTVKFDASLEAHFRLNVDPKQTDQKIRTQVLLPHGTGKTLKVAAFVSPAKEKAAQEGGAHLVGGEELIKLIKDKGVTDFDVAVAEPAMMKSLASIAKILGQRGLMPSPKTGTVGPEIEKMVRELKGGRVDVKTDDSGNIHQVIGKVSFDDPKLVENFQALIEAVKKAKPSTVKKDFIASITLSTSMGPGIKIKP